uniref:Uncharacterized protein n=1 Tax=Panagrolaimus davidi TaxID=227884 RepID=A0A914PJY2_9BILA
MSDAESSDLSSISSDETETDSNSDSTETDSNASYSDFEDSFNEKFVIPQPNFCEFIYQQNFPFHNTFMDYISKNVKSAEVYQNLIQTCKYFFRKNPIVFIAEAYNNFGEDTWNMRLKFKDISCKVWVTHKIENGIKRDDKDDYIQNIIPKIYKSDIKKFYLYEHRISLKELIFLCSSRCRKIRLSSVIFEKNDDGTDITLERIIEVLPKLKYFD